MHLYGKKHVTLVEAYDTARDELPSQPKTTFSSSAYIVPVSSSVPLCATRPGIKLGRVDQPCPVRM